MSPRPDRAPQARFFATAAKGTERLLAEELTELGLPAVSAARGGAYFGETRADGYRACLWSRIALRVHQPLSSFECRDGDDLYAAVKAIDWLEYLDGQRTLAVRAAGQNDKLSHTHFISVRAKDAIVDQLRERRGQRPNVDRDNPDVLLFVHLSGQRATLNIDLSGASLHLRGFRSEEGTAPLRETLAAALVRFSGWRGDTPLCDPMCGSGMLLLEAGLWAARRAPGLGRERFGFEGWSNFDPSARAELGSLREQARAAARPAPPLFGSDSDPRALEQCAANAARAGLSPQLDALPFARVSPGADIGGLLANPPYGERLARPEHLERDLDALLERFASAQRCLIVPQGFPSRLRSTRFQAVFNGPIECELRRYDAGSVQLQPASTRPRAPERNAPVDRLQRAAPNVRDRRQPSERPSAGPRSTDPRGSDPRGNDPRNRDPRVPGERAPSASPPPAGPRLSFRRKPEPK